MTLRAAFLAILLVFFCAVGARAQSVRSTVAIPSCGAAGQFVTGPGACGGPTLPVKSEVVSYSVQASDTLVWLCASGGTAITFTLPNPGTATGNTYQFRDCAGHGYVLATVGGTATIGGANFFGGPASSQAVPPNTDVTCVDDGAAYSSCQVVASVAVTNAFFVSASGSDSNAGTLAAPFLTLGKCQTAMRASTAAKSCYVRAGTYSMGSGIVLDTRDAGETWSYYPPDGPQPPALTQTAAFAFFNLGGGANGITITGFSATGFSSAAHGSCSGAWFVDSDSSVKISDDAITYNKITNFDCGVVIQDAYNPVVSYNNLDTISYAAIACYHCTGLPEQTVWRGNTIINLNVGGTSNDNTYGIVFSNNQNGSTQNITAENNVVANSVTWTCYSDHAGTDIYWLNNLCVGFGSTLIAGIHVTPISAGSSPTGFMIPLINPVLTGNVIDAGSLGRTNAVNVCGDGAACNSYTDIFAGSVTNNTGLMGASGFSSFSPVVTQSSNSWTGTPETVSTVKFGDGTTSASFTAGLSGAPVATLQVTMSGTAWAFPIPPGTLAIGGTNSGGFVVCNLNQVCQKSGGTAAGTYNDFTVVVTLPGMSGSPATISAGTLTLTGT